MTKGKFPKLYDFENLEDNGEAQIDVARSVGEIL